MNTKQTDQKKKRWIGALLAGGIMIAFCIWFLAFMAWAFLQESPDELPAFFAVVILLFPLIALTCKRKYCSVQKSGKGFYGWD